MKKLRSEVKWVGREEVTLDVTFDAAEEIHEARITCLGGPELLSLVTEYRSKHLSPGQHLKLKELPLPQGRRPAVLCLREAILKIRGEWDFPYKEEELCHCRAVLTAVVDQAICAGAHAARKVSEVTSASTACGTCRPDVEAILKFRLGD
jgi:bacterioferritin-associated ferredoxin